MKRLAILGASGHGKVIADIAECLGWQVFFFDDRKQLGPTCLSWPIVGCSGDLIGSLDQFEGVLVGIGENRIRLEKSLSLLALGARLISLIHPSAFVSRYAELGLGSVVMPGAVINAAACIGVACIINTGASVDHDCVLGAGVHISPGAHLAGGVLVGERSWIGIGAAIRQQVRIGARAIVAAGAIVIGDVEDNAVVMGVPAIRRR